MPDIRSKSLLIALLCLPLHFGGCSNDVDLRCDDSNVIHIDKHALDFFYFKKGTWWLFKSEGSELTDSIWVSKAAIEWHNPHDTKRACRCGYGKCTEQASLRFENRAHNGSEMLCSHTISTSLESGKTSIYGGVPLTGSGFSPLGGGWRYRDKRILETTESSPYVFEALDTITVNGKLYKDILHQYIPSGQYGNDWLREVWFARNFFVIRFTTDGDRTWNLADCHIEQ